MRQIFAIPTLDGRSCAHFGHCRSFALVSVVDGKIHAVAHADPPEHQPGSFPRFLAEQGVNIVLAGGMGGRARELFAENGIEVHLGVGIHDPRELVEDYLRDELEAGDNACNHGAPGHEPTCGH